MKNSKLNIKSILFSVILSTGLGGTLTLSGQTCSIEPTSFRSVVFRPGSYLQNIYDSILQDQNGQFKILYIDLRAIVNKRAVYLITIDTFDRVRALSAIDADSILKEFKAPTLENWQPISAGKSEQMALFVNCPQVNEELFQVLVISNPSKHIDIQLLSMSEDIGEVLGKVAGYELVKRSYRRLCSVFGITRLNSE